MALPATGPISMANVKVLMAVPDGVPISFGNVAFSGLSTKDFTSLRNKNY